jgi:subtilase family protein/ASPM-SPD-2-Hydin domain-containing protein
MSSRHEVWYLRALWLAPALALAGCGELDPAREASTATMVKTGGGPVTVDDGGELVPGQLIAKLAVPVEAGSPVEVGGQVLTPIEELADGAWLMAIEASDVIAARDVRTPPQRTRDALAAVRADPAVVYAHGNDIMRFSWLPNDTYYSLQWNYPQIGLPSAWDVTRGAASARIAIFDSGQTEDPDHPDPNHPEHPDLVGRYTGGRDFVDGSGPTDVGAWHHGTHVAGILGAITDNAKGGAGICPGCTLIPVRMTDATLALDLGRFVRALNWAAGDLDPQGKRQADVVTLSMNLATTLDCDTYYHDVSVAVQHANARGVVVVNSAGNFSTAPTMPASCPGIVSVAATQIDQTLAAYSNRGARIDLAAPGGAGAAGSGGSAGGGFGPGLDCRSDIPDPDPTFGTTAGGVLSSWALSSAVTPTAADYCYRYLSGTSMAAPHVAATFGLMLSVLPNGAFTPAQLLKMMTLTAHPLPCTATHLCGAGLLDAGRAVHAAQHGAAPVLAAAPATLDFGLVALGSAGSLTLNVANQGVGPLTIAGAPSIQIIGADAPQFELGLAGCNGGQSCAQTIAVPEEQTTTLALRCRPKASGRFDATLVLHGDSLNGDASVPLHCTATAPQLVPSATSLTFPLAHLGATATQSLTISNAGNAMLSLVATTAAPFSLTCPGCSCAGQTCTVAPSGNVTLSVSYTASAIGTQNGAIAISSNDPAHPSTSVSLSGSGGIGTGSLTSLAFGTVMVGASATGTLTLSNTGSFPLTVSAMDIADPADFAFAYPSGPCANAARCTTPLQVVTSLAIPVRCHPAGENAYSSLVTLTTDGSVAAVTASLTCTGAVPHIALTPASGVDLGTVRVGASASSEISVANTTAGTSLAFSVSQGSSQFNLSCAAGCTCADDICTGTVGATPARVVVAFAPTAVGAASANVTFLSNDVAAEVRTLVATGTGSGPVFQRVEPASGELEFVTPPGTLSAPGLVRIANSGNADLHITGASITGPASGALQMSPRLPVTVHPGATVDFAVTCMPTWSTGTQTGRLGFAADAGTTTIIDISCTAALIGSR